MQYASVCPKACKLGLLDCYLNTAFNLCASFVVFKDDLSKIKNILLKIQYPEELIRIKIHKILETNKINKLTFKQEQKTNTGKQSKKKTL